MWAPRTLGVGGGGVGGFDAWVYREDRVDEEGEEEEESRLLLPRRRRRFRRCDRKANSNIERRVPRKGISNIDLLSFIPSSWLDLSCPLAFTSPDEPTTPSL